MKDILALMLAGVMAAAVGGCSSEPPKKTEETKTEAPKPAAEAPEHLTGRAAFGKVFVAARGFAADVKPYRLESTPTEGANGHDGKSGLWRAGFASASRRSVKSFTWSGLTGPNAPDRGVSASTEDTYSPTNSSTQVFDIAFLKVDSENAFETAQKKGGEALLKKEPETPVKYVLDWNGAENKLIWHVIYGDTHPKLRIAVDASSGEFLRKER